MSGSRSPEPIGDMLGMDGLGLLEEQEPILPSTRVKLDAIELISVDRLCRLMIELSRL